MTKTIPALSLKLAAPLNAASAAGRWFGLTPKALGTAGVRRYSKAMQGRQREGFSIVEALVVLAISGMALAIIFTIGIRAGDTGFALGRKAMSAADLDLAVSDLRSLMRSYELRPGDTFVDGVDEPLIGTMDRIAGPPSWNVPPNVRLRAGRANWCLLWKATT
jgi:hypothetical protein